MPSRKQRRRQQKLRRHEWEEVYVDDDGNEVPLEAVEAQDEKPARKQEARATANGQAKAKPAKSAAQRGAGRVIQPPSWTRVLKRAAIFAPIMFLVVSLFSKGFTVQQKVMQTLFLLVFFIPFSYLMDSMMYRSYRKRTGQSDTPAKKS